MKPNLAIPTERDNSTWSPHPWEAEERRETLKAIIYPTLVMWGCAFLLCSTIFYFVAWWDNGAPVPLW